MIVTNEKFLSLFTKYGEFEKGKFPDGDYDVEPENNTGSSKQILPDLKLKSAVQLGDVLRTTREILDIYNDQNGFDIEDR